MRNTEWTTPFILPENGVTVRLTDTAGRATAPAGSRVREVAIMTVPAAAADGIRGKLNIQLLTLSDGRKMSVQTTERTNGDGSVTFGVRLFRGIGISFR